MRCILFYHAMMCTKYDCGIVLLVGRADCHPNCLFICIAANQIPIKTLFFFWTLDNNSIDEHLWVLLTRAINLRFDAKGRVEKR